MKIINISNTLSNLSKNRQLFCSEADFQQALAWQIHEDYKEDKVFLEYPLTIQQDGKDKPIRVDIVVKHDEEYIPIELKYLTKKLKIKEPEVEFELKNQGARDIRMHDVLADVERIENIIDQNKLNQCSSGYQITLTNDKGYLTESRGNHLYKNFSLHEGREIPTDTLKWNGKPPRSFYDSSKRPITLRSSYKINWDKDTFKTYGFNLLIFEIMRGS